MTIMILLCAGELLECFQGPTKAVFLVWGQLMPAPYKNLFSAFSFTDDDTDCSHAVDIWT